MTDAVTTSFAEDVDALALFHERAYDGEDITTEEALAARTVWWRLIEHPETIGNIGVFSLLNYSMKYFPHTYDNEES